MNVTANDIFAAKGGIESPELDRCCDWLSELLEDFKILAANEIFKMGKEEGFSKNTKKRAKKKLKVKSSYEWDEQSQRKWYWRLPEQEDNQYQLQNLRQIKEKTASDLKKVMENTGDSKRISP